MSDSDPPWQFSDLAQIVYERGAWVVYDGTPTPPRHLTASDLASCLRSVADAADIDGVVSSVSEPERLVPPGLSIASEGSSVPYNRASWAARSWNAAFDFAVALYNSTEPVDCPRLVWSTPGASGQIDEAYPATPTAPPLSRSTLSSLLKDVRTSDPLRCFEVAVAAIDVTGLNPGWYDWQCEPWPGAVDLPESTELARLAPVAYGRTEYSVKALLIILVVDLSIQEITPTAYAQLLVRGGVLVGRFESAAHDEGLSCRANYAVSSEIATSLCKDADTVMPIGAVALGSR